MCVGWGCRRIVTQDWNDDGPNWGTSLTTVEQSTDGAIATFTTEGSLVQREEGGGNGSAVSGEHYATPTM